ncbi:MAG: hypothetical protein DI606_16360 [Sphingobium sp.]|uniref:hypothetical protein n=1 Tax=Sphingobium sp. TaxID=1912891 RepID=UPI000DB0312D|nr:hypothetical protein [Sphingobium sp.]PZU07654.1 MAG: hypothetical protein DI606_16360 [Sphingobium sp.]
MIYFLTALCAFMFFAVCGACHRLQKAEEHIEIIRTALERHLTDGSDYQTSKSIGQYQGKWRVQLGDRTWSGKDGDA